jgi:hypothetical protein
MIAFAIAAPAIVFVLAAVMLGFPTVVTGTLCAIFPFVAISIEGNIKRKRDGAGQ